MEDNRADKGIDTSFAMMAISLVMDVVMSLASSTWIRALAIIVCDIITLGLGLYSSKKRGHGMFLICVVVLFINIVILAVNIRSVDKKQLPEEVDTYEVRLNFEEVEMKFWNDSDSKNVLLPVNSGLDIEYAKIEALDYDVLIEDIRMNGNTMVISGVPSGNIGINIKFKEYDQYAVNAKFNKKDLQDGKWEKDIYIEKECDYGQYNVSVVDKAGNGFANSQVDLWVNDDRENRSNFVTNSSGKIPYVFSCPTDSIMRIILYIDDKQYEMSANLEKETEKVTFVCADAKSPITIQQEALNDNKNTEETSESQEIESELVTPVELLEKQSTSNFDIISSAAILREWDANLTENNYKNEDQISLDEKSAICIEFSHDNLTEDKSGWNINVRNTDGDIVFSFVSRWNKEDTYSPIVGLDSGTYYIDVESTNFSSAKYHIKILKISEIDFESENNNTVLNADSFGELATNEIKTKYGSISDYSDVDYYKFQTNDYGVVAFDFQHLNYTDDQNGWRIKLWDSDMNMLYEFTSAWTNTKTGTPNIGIPKGEYYISVEECSNLNQNLYALNIVWTNNENWEAEPNDEILSATEIKQEKYTYGSTILNSDVDYFKYTCTNTGKYWVSFEHDTDFKDECAWKFLVLDEEGNDVLDEEIGIKLSQGMTRRMVSLTENEVYYIKVTPTSNLSTKDYKIRVCAQ